MDTLAFKRAFVVIVVVVVVVVVLVAVDVVFCCAVRSRSGRRKLRLWFRQSIHVKASRFKC